MEETGVNVGAEPLARYKNALVSLCIAALATLSLSLCVSHFKCTKWRVLRQHTLLMVFTVRVDQSI